MKPLRHFVVHAAGALVITGCIALALSRGFAAEAAGGKETIAASATSPRIEIRDFQFQPANLTVMAGTTVVFVNRDEEPHTVASKDGKFTKSKALDTDQEFSVTLTVPGEYGYFCTVHPHMSGKITVTQP